MESFFVPYEAVEGLPGRCIAVLAPHADDEVLGCGGLLADYVARGAIVRVLVLSGEADATLRMVRARESCQAATLMGYPEPEFWDYPDGHLTEQRGLEARLGDWVEALGADLVLAPSPWEMHRDHRAVAKMAMAILGRLMPSSYIGFYEVGQPLIPNRLVDITPWFELKARAMACFTSQLARQPYDRHMTALNCYRTYSLPPSVKAAEAYLLLTQSQLLESGLMQDTARLSHVLYQAQRVLEVQRDTLAAQRIQGEQQRAQLAVSQAQLDEVLRSTSWRWAAPVRWWGRWVRGWRTRATFFLATPKATSVPVVPLPKQWTITPFPAEQTDAMASLFHAVFGHPLDPALREWKYGPGRGRSMAAWDAAGNLVGHYGGLVRQVCYFGQGMETCQIGDVMVAPTFRGVLTRKGMLYQMTQAFYEAQSPAQRQAAFGFPNARAYQVGARLAFYASAGRLYLRTWPVQFRSGASLLVPFWEVGDASTIAGQLWSQMAQDGLSLALVVRDYAYLNYRYRERPAGNYQTFLVKSEETGADLALLVVKAQGETLDWMDYVGPFKHVGVALSALQCWALAQGYVMLRAWISTPMLEIFADPAAVTQETDVEIAQWDCHDLKGHADKTRHCWWVMYGDTDFL